MSADFDDYWQAADWQVADTFYATERNTTFVIGDTSMAWEISISSEGWAEIRDKLEGWSRNQLIDAIADDKFELVYANAALEHAELAANAERKRLANLPIDVLADRAFELIETNNTCDNGGWNYWVDREGYHKVSLEE
jgi:hypothetical protein